MRAGPTESVSISTRRAGHERHRFHHRGQAVRDAGGKSAHLCECMNASLQIAAWGSISFHACLQVSVGHRTQLVEYHTHVLEHDDGLASGGWQMCTSEEYKRKLSAHTHA